MKNLSMLAAKRKEVSVPKPKNTPVFLVNTGNSKESEKISS